MATSILFGMLTFVFNFFILLNAIEDPLNIFCGNSNCYSVLGVDRTSNLKEIKRAFRNLSLTMHPDKNKAANATDVFKLITKAFEVLSSNETRKNFDYYIDNPRDYYKVSGGHHINRVVPKTNLFVVLFTLVLLISWLFHYVQEQKYKKAVAFLKNATLNNFSLKQGGSKLSVELYQRAISQYEKQVKEGVIKNPIRGSAKSVSKDPEFVKIVDQIVNNVKIEGGYRKPEFNDLFIIVLLTSPVWMFKWIQKYYIRHFSNKPLSYEEMVEMSIETVGLGTWNELGQEEKDELIANKVWLNRAALVEEFDKNEIEDENVGSKSEFVKRKVVSGKKKKE